MWRLVIVLIAAVCLFAPTPSGGGTTASGLAFARDGDIWTIGADGMRARPLLRDAYAPAWSPDGSRFAFVSGRSGDEEIYVARADGTGWAPDVSPDGERIAFTQLPGTIWIMNVDGSGLRRLTRGFDAAWRP